MQVYQDATISIEGGQYKVDKNEGSMVGSTSTGGASTTGPVQVKLGKLGKHINFICKNLSMYNTYLCIHDDIIAIHT